MNSPHYYDGQGAPPNKRQRRTVSDMNDMVLVRNVSVEEASSPQHEPATTSLQSVTLGALEIVQGHFLLDIQTKNNNLQQLVEEMDNYSTQYNNNNNAIVNNERFAVGSNNNKLRTPLDEAKLQSIQNQRQHNSIFQWSTNIHTDNTWHIARDEYVYDPHITGEADMYDVDDEPLFPACDSSLPRGYEALFVVLESESSDGSGSNDKVNEWRVLQMTNNYLSARVQNKMHQLRLNVMMNQLGYDYFAALHLRNDEPIFERVERELSELSAHVLSDYMWSSNLDLREAIARFAQECGAFDDLFTDLYGDTSLAFQLIEEYGDISKGKSIKFLPKIRNVAYDTLEKIENLWLGEKLDGVILQLKLELIGERLNGDDDEEFEDDEDSIFSFFVDDYPDEEIDDYLDEEIENMR